MVALQLALFSSLGTNTLADVNVFDQPMSQCGAGHATGCPYYAGDAGAHEVCVTKLPHGFSSDTGQGPWSDIYTGQPWCICIWAYSNYILQKKDLLLDCAAIPSKVLEEQYSLDKFAQCGQMSSTGGCGPEDIRRSIQSLCTQCEVQAGDASSKTALKQKCDAILQSAPPADMLWIDDGNDSEEYGKADGKLFSLLVTGSGLLIAGASVAMVVRILRKRRHGSIAGQHDELGQLNSAAEDNDDMFIREELAS